VVLFFKVFLALARVATKLPPPSWSRPDGVVVSKVVGVALPAKQIIATGCSLKLPDREQLSPSYLFSHYLYFFSGFRNTPPCTFALIESCRIDHMTIYQWVSSPEVPHQLLLDISALVGSSFPK
jgi:hypothetical protein